MAASQTSSSFASGFLQSLALTGACELGDRTFFMAAILAMRASRSAVWSGVLLAVAAITLFSAGLGRLFPFLLRDWCAGAAATTLFLAFGLHQLHQWWTTADAPENAELCQAERDVAAFYAAAPKTAAAAAHDDSDDDAATAKRRRRAAATPAAGDVAALPVLLKAMSVTFAAEMGDRSQLATAALAGSRHFAGVVVGGIVAHAVCTAIAVVGGRMLSRRISERTVMLVSGLTFTAMSIVSLITCAR